MRFGDSLARVGLTDMRPPMWAVFAGPAHLMGYLKSSLSLGNMYPSPQPPHMHTKCCRLMDYATQRQAVTVSQRQLHLLGQASSMAGTNPMCNVEIWCPAPNVPPYDKDVGPTEAIRLVS